MVDQLSNTGQSDWLADFTWPVWLVCFVSGSTVLDYYVRSSNWKFDPRALTEEESAGVVSWQISFQVLYKGITSREPVDIHTLRPRPVSEFYFMSLKNSPRLKTPASTFASRISLFQGGGMWKSDAFQAYIFKYFNLNTALKYYTIWPYLELST
jgi:hypothetical protein